MAGYIGTKAVNLSTTGADIAGDADVNGDLTVDTNTLHVDSTNNRVGIGTDSPSTILHVSSSDPEFMLTDTSTGVDHSLDGNSGTGVLRLHVDKNSEASGPAYIINMAGSEAMRIDSSGNVGIGTSSPSDVLHVSGGSSTDGILIQNPLSGSFYNAKLEFTRDNTSGGAKIQTERNAAGGVGLSFNYTSSNANEVSGTYSEAMRIDSSGNLLVGTTTNSSSNNGVTAGNSGLITATRTSNYSAIFNRKTSDGDIAQFRKDATTVGSIGTNGSGRLYIASGDTGLDFEASTNAIRPCSGAGGGRDNVIDLGRPDVRFDDIYATNGTIQTSDRNEKQDIEVLSDAEQRVAVAAKGLMRKFRWQDAVAEKGDDARTHFGIIAQDLQAAFAAEGLDAGDYAMFISTTWWETQTEVPAVEAVAEVLDEEGNVVTEAVEAVDAYTRTDTYDTQEEAPEGATERTRLGVRYSELLAFIIGAL